MSIEQYFSLKSFDALIVAFVQVSSMGKKRKNESCPAQAVVEDTQGLHGVSDESRRVIFNAAARAFDRQDDQVNRSNWKQIASSICPDIFFPVSVAGVNDIPVMFYMADVKKLLQHVIVTCHGYAHEIQNCLHEAPGTIFELILYNDEATGGNVLQQESWKKASLWYFCLKEVGYRWCEQVWHPLCLIQHNDFDKAEGCFSGIVCDFASPLGPRSANWLPSVLAKRRYDSEMQSPLDDIRP